MRSVKDTQDALNYLVENSPKYRGMRWIVDLYTEYVDGLITFGEMLDSMQMDEKNSTIGAKFDLLLTLGFNLEEAKRLLLG